LNELIENIASTFTAKDLYCLPISATLNCVDSGHHRVYRNPYLQMHSVRAQNATDLAGGAYDAPQTIVGWGAGAGHTMSFPLAPWRPRCLDLGAIGE